MTTLQSRIATCEAKTKELKEANPEIHTIEYRLHDCELDEIKELIKPGATLNIFDDKYWSVVSIDNSTIIIAYTRPFKSVRDIEYEF